MDRKARGMEFLVGVRYLHSFCTCFHNELVYTGISKLVASRNRMFCLVSCHSEDVAVHLFSGVGSLQERCGNQSITCDLPCPTCFSLSLVTSLWQAVSGWRCQQPQGSQLVLAMPSRSHSEKTSQSEAARSEHICCIWLAVQWSKLQTLANTLKVAPCYA